LQISEELQAKLDHLPQKPGCYLFRDKAGKVLYVGKAKSLKHRVRSYFQEGSSDTRPFIAFLSTLLADIEVVVTESEREALILEHSLAREHKPRFNVKLRDDKNFLSLRLGVADAWPRLTPVRRAEADGARYFGPYHSATAARRTLQLVNKHFQLRTCSDVDMQSRKRPCLQHQIKRCPAPCVFEVDEKFYRDEVATVRMFLEGKHDELTMTLHDRMRTASTAMDFEVAAIHRDQLRALETIRESQRVISSDGVDRDVFAVYRDGDLAEVSALYIRSGRLQDVVTTTIKDAVLDDASLLQSFLENHYGLSHAAGGAPIPTEVVVPSELPDGELLELLLRERGSDESSTRVELSVPQRGKKRELIDLALENAKAAFEEKRRRKDDIEERLIKLQDKLRLPELPKRIECCDISHLGGEDSVGAIVAMNMGELDKSRYRIFHVKSTAHRGGDDYGAMYEVLSRRFRRARAEADWDPPQLFVVDGGRGQLQVALAAARDLGLHDLRVVGLAKERETLGGELLVDRVYLPGQKNPLTLRTSSALLLLARLRDEAHRFSNRAREKVGKAKRFSSALDEIPGVGPQLRRLLLQTFGSTKRIQAASDEELLAVKGISAAKLAQIRLVLPHTVLANQVLSNADDVGT
jgi:excinuclease ABC subunit C